MEFLKTNMISMQCFQTGLLGVNTYLVSCSSDSDNTKNVFVVDPGGDASFIADRINEINGNLVGIVLTHGHFDHVGALTSLKEMFPNALVCIHSGDADYVGENGYKTHTESFLRIGFENKDFFTHEKMCSADLFLDAEKYLPFAPNWHIIHTPGHTEGSVCLYNEKEKALLSGDTLFKMAYGRTDLPGGSFSKLKKSLENLFTLPGDTKVYPGHESTTTIAQEMNMHL